MTWSAGSKFGNHQLQPWRLRWLWMWLWWSQLWMRPNAIAGHGAANMWTNLCMPTKNRHEESSDFWRCMKLNMMSNESPHYSTHGKKSKTTNYSLAYPASWAHGQLSSGEEFAKNVEEHFRADAGTKWGRGGRSWIRRDSAIRSVQSCHGTCH